MKKTSFLSLWAIALVANLLTTNQAWAQKPSPKLLTPDNSVVLLIDHQSQMAFGVKNIDVTLLRNNLAGLSKAAKTFNVPVILTSVSQQVAGPVWSEITNVFPNAPIIDRTTMNSWEDPRVVDAIKKTGRKKIVLAGLWTQVCGAFVALSALDEGYEVYFVTDASGDMSTEIHDGAVMRMAQAGVAPVNWLQVMLEWQRDWARKATYDSVVQTIKDHAGVYGIGMIYYASNVGGKGEGATGETAPKNIPAPKNTPAPQKAAGRKASAKGK
jgi:nicotinamidase-related amidase